MGSSDKKEKGNGYDNVKELLKDGGNEYLLSILRMPTVNG